MAMIRAFLCCLFCLLSCKTSSVEAKTFIRLPSEAIIVTEGQSINVMCRTIPSNAITKWTFNGTDKSTIAELFSVNGRYNHTLSIIRSTLENAGRYTCHVVDTDVNASFDLIVKPVACPSNISHGLVWEGQSEGTTAFQRCSNLHQNFRSRVYASRRCNAKGEWEEVDLTNCTMHLNSDPVIVAQATLTPANAFVVTYFNASVYSVLVASRYQVTDIRIETLFHREEETITVAVIGTVYRDDIAVNDLKLSIIKWLKADRDSPKDNTTESLNPIDTISDVEVTGYLPSLYCRCNVTAEPDSVNTVCMGANVPPCVMMNDRYQCNNPLFVGNGDVCGLDSDGDGFPDAELKCDDQYCRMDVCPDVYSTTAFGTQDLAACSEINHILGTAPNITGEPFDGCQAEVDETWQLYWPQTPVNSVTIRRCGGIDSIGLVRRRCIQNNTWGPVEDFRNCYSSEISSLFDSSRQLRSYYYGDNIFDYFDIREFPLLDVNTASSELYFLTNSSQPLAPRDLISINGILDTIISINEELDFSEDGNISTLAGDLFATFSNLLNDSNSISYQIDDYGYDYDSDYDYYYYEEGYNTAEALLRNIDSFASVFKSLLISYAQQHIKYNDKNFNISFEMPSDEELQSSGGIEFNAGQSQIYIPYTAIRHQVSTEGVHVPVVNYAARNLASVLPARALNNITEVGNQVVSSQISSGPISLPPDGYIRLTFMLDKPLDGEPKCVFWNYTLEVDNATGGWSDRDVFMDVENSNSTTVTCITKHLTSFAVLVDHSGTVIDNDKKSTVQSTALSIVSYIGCGVSIICLIATVCAILLFRRSVFKDRQHMIHLNLATALLLGLIVFVSGIETASGNRLACIAVTVLLHYFFLAAFCWMLCEGIIIYLLLVKVFYNGFFKSMLFYAAIGWGLPIPVVAITLGVSYDSYGDRDICWLPEDKGIIWAFIGPVILIMLCNFTILLIAIYSIYKASRHKKDHQGMTNVKMAKNLIKATVILLPILGCTWIIGIIAVNESLIVFAWIFTILNSLQGVCIFILYVVRSGELKKKIRSSLGIETTKSKGTSYSSTIRMTFRNFSRSTLFSGMQKKSESQISHINIKCDTEQEKTSNTSNFDSDSLGTNEQPNSVKDTSMV